MKRIIVIIVFVLSAALYIILNDSIKNEPINNLDYPQTKDQNKEEIKKSESLNIIKKSKPITKKKIHPKKSKSSSQKEIILPRKSKEYLNNLNLGKECTKSLQSIAELSLDDIISDKNFIKTASSTCKSLPISKTLNEIDCNKNKGKCATEIAIYRAKIIDILTKNEELKDLSSNILYNKLLALEQTLQTKEGIETAVNIAEELVEKDPSSMSAQKANVMFSLVKSFQGDEKPNWDNLIDKITEAKINANLDSDDEIFEAHILTLLKSNRENEFIDLTEQYISDNPSSGIGNYYTASYYWKKQNRQKAQQELLKAIQKDPQNQRYLITLKKSQDSSFKDTIFEMSLALDNLGDLIN